jgi:hypothetical protein
MATANLLDDQTRFADQFDAHLEANGKTGDQVEPRHQ